MPQNQDGLSKLTAIMQLMQGLDAPERQAQQQQQSHALQYMQMQQQQQQGQATLKELQNYHQQMAMQNDSHSQLGYAQLKEGSRQHDLAMKEAELQRATQIFSAMKGTPEGSIHNPMFVGAASVIGNHFGGPGGGEASVQQMAQNEVGKLAGPLGDLYKGFKPGDVKWKNAAQELFTSPAFRQAYGNPLTQPVLQQLVESANQGLAKPLLAGIPMTPTEQQQQGIDKTNQWIAQAKQRDEDAQAKTLAASQDQTLKNNAWMALAKNDPQAYAAELTKQSAAAQQYKQQQEQKEPFSIWNFLSF